MSDLKRKNLVERNLADMHRGGEGVHFTESQRALKKNKEEEEERINAKLKKK
ncbi:hypothetical protein [Leeuwenhoekiella parthenopeia]|uniref:Uncharacterized protein n=1 Tax=Leeuwenhoekiella parthenopeia TaxID=2890320 RepID=A0ABS8GW88_9FLAO|nr:hypothetical protein [Leeuwenhoekiella parthenopeia]MCC4214046.1 hypothetical protein [Leeuwenhoekiella parthenopeia]